MVINEKLNIILLESFPSKQVETIPDNNYQLTDVSLAAAVREPFITLSERMSPRSNFCLHCTR